MSDKTRLENNNLELMNIYNAVENLPNAGGGGGDVKLYDTIANMNLDHSVSEGQLAIVYSNVSANITADTEFQIGTFPEVVVLPTAITDYLEVGFRAVDESVMFDCWGQLDASRYDISCYSENGGINIQYESQDGITYTRTRFMKNDEEISGDEMDFGLTIKFGSRWGGAEWNDVIGYFTQAGAVAFDGLYQYGDNAYSLAKTQFDTSSDVVYKSIFYGKNGIEEGALQNVENITNDQKIRKKAEIYSSISRLNLAENITNLGSVFYNKMNLITVPNMSTQRITTTDFMFAECTNLEYVPNFDTGNVTNMVNMFYNCGNLAFVPNFNLASAENISQMFYNCHTLTSIPNFDISNITSMQSVFYNCTNVISLPNFNTSNVVYMHQTFYNCTNLTTIPNFNTNNLTSLSYTFCNCTNLEIIPNLDISKVTTLVQTFGYCQKLQSIPNFDTSCIANMAFAFRDCTNLMTIPMFNTNNVFDMTMTFTNCNNLSADSYANIANSLPLAASLNNQYVSNIGLNIENFTLTQKQILGNKGYYDALLYITNTSNVSITWNILYS